MKSRKTKGAALVLTLAVTSMLIIFAVSLIAVASSNRMKTFGLERSNQLKMIAQTGMNKSLAILKEEIAQKVISDSDDSILYQFAKYPDVPCIETQLTDLKSSDKQIDSGENYSIAFNVNNSSTPGLTPKAGDCYVEFSDSFKDSYDEGKHQDPSDGIVKSCIKITVYAYGRGGSRRVETAYIDKNSISDYYFDKMFNNAMIALDKSSSPPIGTSGSGASGTITIGGSIYLQGNGFKLNSGDIRLNGKLKVSDSKNFELMNPSSITLYRYQDYSESSSQDTIGPLSVDSLPQSFILQPDSSYTDSEVDPYKFRHLNPLDTIGSAVTEGAILESDKFTVIKEKSGSYPAMVVAKCTGTVDFDKLVLGSELDSHTGLRRYIVKNSASLNIGSYTNESDLLRFYKVIIVHGDLNIDAAKFYYDQITDNTPDTVTLDEFRQLNMVNYIIIASGKVTIKGNLKMINSSILADQIVIETRTKDIPTSGGIYADAPNVLTALQDLITARTASGETVYHTDPPDPLDCDIDVGMNFSTLNGEREAVKSAYSDDRTADVATSVEMDGIGSQDSLRFMINNLGEYETLPSDARGYLSNVQRALMNEYFIRNLSDDYAKQLKFKIIDWQEK